MMTDIRKFNRSAIKNAAKKVRQRFESQKSNDLYYAQEISIFYLRDSEGVYWFLDPGSDQWYCFSNGQWHRANTESIFFEAPNLTAFFDANQPIETHLLPELEESGSQEKMSAADALISIVNEVNSGYEKGTLTSTDAHNLLAQHVMIDLDGGFWTPGIKSRCWYCFKDGEWHKSSEPPPGDDQLFNLRKNERKCFSCEKIVGKGDECPYCGSDDIYGEDSPPEKVSLALPEFLLFGVTAPPENIADPWSPPKSFPEDVMPIGFQCPSCGKRNSLGSHYCNHCGNSHGPETGTPKPTTKPNFCQNCGADLKLGLKFCTQCGAKI